MNNGNTNGTTGDGAGGNGNGISGRMLAGNRLLQFGTPTDVFGNPVGFNNQDRDDPRGLGTMDPNNPMVRYGNATLQKAVHESTRTNAVLLLNLVLPSKSFVYCGWALDV